MSELSDRDKKFASGDSGAPRETQRYIRGAILQSYASTSRAIGIDPYSMLRRAGLPVQALDNPDAQISADRFRELIDRSAEAAKSDDFGMMVGAGFELALFGPLGLLIREQATIGEAIETLARYMRFQNNALELRLRHARDGSLGVMPHLMSARARASRQTVDLKLAIVVRCMRGLMGESWAPLRVTTSAPAPRDPAPFIAYFGPVEFGADTDAVWISRADVEHIQPNANPRIAREIARFIEHQSSGFVDSMADRVEALIEDLLPEGQCTVDRVSLQLGMDRRTVHRKLLAEGVSFTELVDQARRHLVTVQMRDRGQSLAVIAHRLGFASLSTFSRWFRNAYGMRASDFRAAAGF